MMTSGACSIGPPRPRPPGSARQRRTARPLLSVPARMHRVAVLGDGFAWNGKTYASLSKVAFAITGTRWNGPKFFGLRDKPLSKRAS